LAKRREPEPKFGCSQLDEVAVLKPNASGDDCAVDEQGGILLMLGDDPFFASVLQRKVLRPYALGFNAMIAVFRLAKRERKLARLQLITRCVSVQSFDPNLQKIFESTTMRSPG